MSLPHRRSVLNEAKDLSDADRERQAWALQVQRNDREPPDFTMGSPSHHNRPGLHRTDIHPQPAPPAYTQRHLTSQRQSEDTVQANNSTGTLAFRRPVFRFDRASPLLKCRLPTCTIICTSNKETFICPNCDIFSYTRYCSIAHLLTDIRRHYTVECGRFQILTAIDDLTLARPTCGARPYIKEDPVTRNPPLTNHILERHRHAVYRSFYPHVDYFIFTDTDLMEDPFASPFFMEGDRSTIKHRLNRVRGLGAPCAVVALPFPDRRKPLLDQLMNRCLALGQAAAVHEGPRCLHICRIVVRELIRLGEWDEAMSERLAVQMGFEFGWRVPSWLKWPGMKG